MSDPAPPPSPHQQQLLGISTLLQLEKKVRHTHDGAEFGFVVVNETLRLLRYDQAVLWRLNGRAARVAAVSGVDRPNRKSPYLQWLEKLCRFCAGREAFRLPRRLTGEDVPKKLKPGWEQWVGGEGVWCPLLGGDGVLLGGLWLVREDQWQEAEIALLAQLADAYGHAWQALLCRPHWRRRWQGGAASGFLFRLLLLTAVVGAMFLPLRLSVLAPAQIVPVEPLVVSAPMRGVISEFVVQPNQPVKSGDLLFRFDDTETRNRLRVAEKALAETETELRRARQKSLFERDNAVDVDLLQARVAIKKAEVRYAAEELARVAVRANRDGIVLFADVNDWLGQPVATGEKVLLIADPARRELEVQVPVANAINMEPGAEVRLFLNVDPTLDVRAVIHRASYEAKVMPDGTLAFQVRARLADDLPQLRIGLMGTAKIYGRPTRLYYYLFRRPWGAVRRGLGL